MQQRSQFQRSHRQNSMIDVGFKYTCLLTIVIRKPAFCMSRHGTSFTQSCHLMAKRNKLTLLDFLAQRTRYAKFKSVSSQLQNSWRGIQIVTFSHFNHTKIHVHYSVLCRHAAFHKQSCHLVAMHNKLAQWLFYATLKSVSSRHQNSTIGGRFK